jgi:hypothetical protein
VIYAEYMSDVPVSGGFFDESSFNPHVTSAAILSPGGVYQAFQVEQPYGSDFFNMTLRAVPTTCSISCIHGYVNYNCTCACDYGYAGQFCERTGKSNGTIF